MQPRTAVCAACHRVSEAAVHLVCGACKGPRYCDKECQRDHWDAHRAECARVAAERRADPAVRRREVFARNMLRAFEHMLGRPDLGARALLEHAVGPHGGDCMLHFEYDGPLDLAGDHLLVAVYAALGLFVQNVCRRRSGTIVVVAKNGPMRASLTRTPLCRALAENPGLEDHGPLRGSWAAVSLGTGRGREHRCCLKILAPPDRQQTEGTEFAPRQVL